MKINSVNLNVQNINAVNNKHNTPVQPVSFCANDSFEKNIPTLDELFEKVSEVKNKWVELIKEHKNATDDIFKAAIELQNDTMEFKKCTFAEFFLSRDEPEIKAIDELCRGLTNNFASRTLRRYREPIGTPGCMILSSSNKKLADDMLELYPFYMKFKWNQKAYTGNLFGLYEMLTQGFKYNLSVIKKPENTKNYCDEYQNNFIVAIEEASETIKKTGNPTIILMDDMQTLADSTINSSANIASLKEYTCNTGEYGAMVFYSLESPYKKTINRGILHPHRALLQFNLDEIGVNESSIRFLKYAKEGLAPKVEQLDELYSKITREDLERIKKMQELCFKYSDTYEDILKYYPDFIPESFFKQSERQLIEFQTESSFFKLIEDAYLATKKATVQATENIGDIVQKPPKVKKVFNGKIAIIASVVAVTAAGIFAFVKSKNKKNSPALRPDNAVASPALQPTKILSNLSSNNIQSFAESISKLQS